MGGALLSIRWRNLYGNVGMGMCLLVLGLAFSYGLATLGLVSAVLLLTCSGLTFYACLSAKSERFDEMAVANERAAASVALKATLVLVGLILICSLATGASVGLTGFLCFAMGFALSIYGSTFAWLERC